MFAHFSYANVTANQAVDGNAAVSLSSSRESNVDPLVDLFDYYLLDPVSLRQPDTTPVTRDFDIRTARKVRGEDRGLDYNFANSAASAGAIRVTANFRLLIRPD